MFCKASTCWVANGENMTCLTTEGQRKSRVLLACPPNELSLEPFNASVLELKH